MPQHDANLFVLRRVIENIRQGNVHARSHRVLPGRTVQLDTQDTSGSFCNNVTHRLPPSVAPSACRAAGTAPLARNPSIAFASNPSSLRTSSLCSPISGARLADTL